MHCLKIAITRFVDDHEPGFVECTFVDAAGKSHVVIEKVPIVSDEDLTSQSTYPRAGVIRCTVVARLKGERGEPLVRIDTGAPDGVESQEGETVFEVSEALIE